MANDSDTGETKMSGYFYCSFRFYNIVSYIPYNLSIKGVNVMFPFCLLNAPYETAERNHKQMCAFIYLPINQHCNLCVPAFIAIDCIVNLPDRLISLHRGCCIEELPYRCGQFLALFFHLETGERSVAMVSCNLL